MNDTNTGRVIETNSPEETLKLGKELGRAAKPGDVRSEEHTSELQSQR